MKHKLFAPAYWFFDLAKVTAAIPGLLWFRPHVIYESKKASKLIRGGALLCANHQTHYDPVYLQVVVGYRRHRFVCLQEFFSKPSTAWLFRHFLCIPIDREHPKLKTIREIADYLKSGWVVTIFPEGKISTDKISAFQSGIVLMAVQGEAPIIPVYVRPKKHWYDRLTAAIGEPIETTVLCGGRPSIAQIEEIAAELHKREEKLREMLER